MKKSKTLYIVVPCYNEEEVFKETTKRLTKKLKDLIKDNKINSNSKILYVNDGSKDNTWIIIEKENKINNLVTGISLSRNKGHQNALLAGLMTAKKYADIVISMDADLQDDINAVDNMLEEYNKGFEIVYGVRSSRKKDTIFKRVTAKCFYKFMIFLGVDTIYNHADYRLTSKKVLNALESYDEVNLFLRGIFPLIGYPSSIVYYDRNKRFAGKSKYPLKKMLNFAWDGITSFSIKPIRLILKLGIFVGIISLGFLIYTLIRKYTNHTVEGWTFIICSIWLIAGIQMFMLGLIGEYIGKIYAEVKHRPKYIIEKDLTL